MTNERKEFIIQQANQARSRLGIPAIFPIDPIKIAQTYGIDVFTASLDRDVSGIIFYKEKKIYIEQSDYITRQCFSVAHELGHFLLHNDETSHISKRDSTTTQGIDSKEIEANAFAVELLMPKDEILRLVGNKYNLDSMACYFGISPLAMEYRLNNLQLKVYV